MTEPTLSDGANREDETPSQIAARLARKKTRGWRTSFLGIERGFDGFRASTETMGRALDNNLRGPVRAGNGDWGTNNERT